MMYLDLAELPAVFDRYFLWSARRPALAWFRRRDHYGDPSAALDESIRGLIRDRTGKYHQGPIHLLTHLRYFGVCMNPVSFYYCWDHNDKKLKFVVAEVHNTPWNETHCYVLDCEAAGAHNAKYTFSFPKSFHVSPFMSMQQDYVWEIATPTENLLVNMDNLENGTRTFNAYMDLTRIPLSSKNMIFVLAAYPFMTLKVISAIYWQALKLGFKKTPFFPHPKYPNKEAKQ